MGGGHVNWVEVGKRLRQARRETKMSQREFGCRFSVSQNMISLYEKGRSRASVEFYMEVARFTGKSLEWLLLGKPDRTSETLHEIRDLHDRIRDQLLVVRRLVEWQTETDSDIRISLIDNPVTLRKILLEETDLPRSLRRTIEDHELWRELAMTGTEIWMYRTLARVFGDLTLDGLRRFLALVRENRAHTPRDENEGPSADLRDAVNDEFSALEERFDSPSGPDFR